MHLLEKIPAHVRYPGLVIGLLVGSMTAQFFLARAAFSGGGPQIEQNYYQRALEVDKLGARNAASRELGWRIRELPAPGKPTAIVLAVEDADGASVEGLTGEVVLTRPHISGEGERFALAPGAAPGTYEVAWGGGARGLWDLDISASRQANEVEFYQTLRIER